MTDKEKNKVVIQAFNNLLIAQGFSQEEANAILDRLFQALNERLFEHEQFRGLWLEKISRDFARKMLGPNVSLESVDRLSARYLGRIEGVITSGIYDAAKGGIHAGLEALVDQLKKFAPEFQEEKRQIEVGRAPPLRGRIRGATGSTWRYIFEGSGLTLNIHPSQRFIVDPPKLGHDVIGSGRVATGFENVVRNNALWLCQLKSGTMGELVVTPAGASVFRKLGVDNVVLKPLAPHTVAGSIFSDWSIFDTNRVDVWDIDITSGMGNLTMVSLNLLQAFLEVGIEDTVIEPTDSSQFSAPPEHK